MFQGGATPRRCEGWPGINRSSKHACTHPCNSERAALHFPAGPSAVAAEAKVPSGARAATGRMPRAEYHCRSCGKGKQMIDGHRPAPVFIPEALRPKQPVDCPHKLICTGCAKKISTAVRAQRDQMQLRGGPVLPAPNGGRAAPKRKHVQQVERAASSQQAARPSDRAVIRRGVAQPWRGRPEPLGLVARRPELAGLDEILGGGGALVKRARRPPAPRRGRGSSVGILKRSRRQQPASGTVASMRRLSAP